jgi:RNA polymerase sigma-70 factor (ECF subfamily)
VLASLVGFLGDFDLAEEAAQEAFTIAAQRWPAAGMPDNPRAWLIATARNRAIDRLRRSRTLAAKARLLEVREEVSEELDESVIPDERLELLFTCCHPALATEAQVALTLRALGGLSTDEIARAFLVPPETMKRRLTRAKAKIKAAGIPFTVPPAHLLPELVALMPDEPEAHGLLALMVLHDARRQARFAPDGELVLLGDQDRSLWDGAAIAEGRAMLERALALRGRGAYVLQAAIASLQIEPQIDWAQVAALYDELYALTLSPVVELNRAVAVAECEGPLPALEIVERLALTDYQYWHSTRAELLRRLGRAEDAQGAYRSALELAHSQPERDFLERRLGELQ